MTQPDPSSRVRPRVRIVPSGTFPAGVRRNGRRRMLKPVFPVNAAKSFKRFVLASTRARIQKIERLTLSFGSSNAIVQSQPAPNLRSDSLSEFELNQIRLGFERLGLTFAIEDRTVNYRAIRRDAGYFANFQGSKFSEALSRLIGVDLLTQEPWLEGFLTTFTAENVALIKNVSSEAMGRAESLLLASFRQGLRHEELAKQLRSALNISEGRAKFIARDQVLKLNSSLSKLRQEDLGITKYRWRNSMDERVRGNPSGLYPKSRPSHWALEGRVFDWDKRPKDSGGYHPGEAALCRCWAEPVLDDLLK